MAETFETHTGFKYPDRENWARYKSNQAGMYALALLSNNVEELQTVFGRQASLAKEWGNKAPSDSPFSNIVREFRFTVNPQGIQVESPAAVIVTPTQGGGQFVEHQGQIYKNISIRGTTGLRPNRRKEGGFSPTFTNAGISPTERTGFDDLVDLANFFNFYYMCKEHPFFSRNVIMVWQNGRDGDYFVVEPLEFRTTRESASSPLTTEYEIRLRTIKRLEISEFFNEEDPYKKRTGLDAFYERMDRHMNNLADAFVEASNFIDTYRAAGQKFLNTIFKPVNTVLDGLAGILNTSRNVFQVPRVTISQVVNNLEDLASALESNAVSYRKAGFNDLQKNAAQSLRRMIRALAAIHSEEYLFEETTSGKIADKTKRRNSFVGARRRTGGDPTELEPSGAGNSVGQSYVNKGETIRKTAKRLLGNSGKWKFLVVLNDLKPPYLSEDGDGVTVLRPGDPILYPTVGADQKAVSKERGQTELSPIEERLGRDIKLKTSQSAGGITLYDFEVGRSGDLETIEGIPNIIQATRIKFETEQGELPLHPKFGIKYPLGVKASSTRSFVDFQVNARATLLGDSRIGDITSFNLEVEGNTITVNASVVVKGFDKELPVKFKVVR